MNSFSHPDFQGHEKVEFIHHAASGLRAIIAIHSRQRGPALGGCRVREYSDSNAALTDVLRLSRDMSRKTAMADLPLGGGRAVVLAEHADALSEQAWEILAQALNDLQGQYVAAEDVGMDLNGLRKLAERTPFVTGAPDAHGHRGGDLSPWTVKSLVACMQQASKDVLGKDSLAGLRVAIQGLGRVGSKLAAELAGHDVELLIADIKPDTAKTVAEATGATIVRPNDILATPADIFAPCALGGVISNETVPRLRCKLIVGGANNQIADTNAGYALHTRQIIQVPDYIANAGGVIRAGLDYLGKHSDEQIGEKCTSMATTLHEVISESQRLGIPPFRIAEDICYRRLQTNQLGR